MDLVIKDLWLPRKGDIKELLIDSEGNVQITVIKNGKIIKGKTQAVELKSDKPKKKKNKIRVCKFTGNTECNICKYNQDGNCVYREWSGDYDMYWRGKDDGYNWVYEEEDEEDEK